MTQENRCYIAYMPYAPIEASFQIGNYEVWPYYKEYHKRIKKEDVINDLYHYFGRFFEWEYDKERGGYDKPLEEIFIISPSSFEFGVDNLSKEQIEEIKTVCHIIAFCAINESPFCGSYSDPFALHILNFKIGAERILIWQTVFEKLEMVKFKKPYNLGTTLLKFKKTPLCEPLGKALQFKNRDKIRRIFRTLELFYHTATNNEMITAEHRLLSLVMCFEVLLNFQGQKKKFADKIENLIDNYEPTMETRAKENNLTYSKTGWWAYDLYNLRSATIHGKEINWDVKKYGNIWTRIEFGGILLRKLIKKILSRESILLPSPADIIVEAESLDEKLEDMVNSFNETYIPWPW